MTVVDAPVADWIFGPAARFLEDYAPGMELDHARGKTVSEFDNYTMTHLTMNTAQGHFNLPFIVEHFAGEFRERLVMGGCTLSLVVGLSAEDMSQTAFGPERLTGLRFPHPVFHGDTLHARSEVIAVDQDTEGSGTVTYRLRGVNQDGAVVCELDRTVRIPRRNAVAPQAGAADPPVAPPAPASDAGAGDADTPPPYLFEDFVPGRRFRHHWGRTIQAAEAVSAAACSLNFNPLYFNRDYARQQGHTDVVVPPLFAFNVVLGLSVADLSETGGPFLGADDVWVSGAIQPGCTLYASSTVVDRRRSASRPGWGIVAWRTEGHDEQGRLLVSYVRRNLSRCRDGDGSAP